MLRLAEVYLNLAEDILGNNATTSDPTALEYLNRVRTRAGMDIKNSISYEDIRYERRIELALEGQYWYDLVRRSYYQQQEVINYMNNQNRNATYNYDKEKDLYEISENYVAPGAGVAIATVKNLTLPFSDVDLSKNHYLQSDADGNVKTVAYEFTENKITDLY